MRGREGGKEESERRVGEDGITFRVSRYLLRVLIEEDEKAARRAIRRRGEENGPWWHEQRGPWAPSSDEIKFYM